MPDHALQSRAAAVLTMLLTTEDLPVCEWTVHTATGLEGKIDVDLNADPMYALQTYAAKFGHAVQRNDMIAFTYGTMDHVPVMVYSVVKL